MAQTPLQLQRQQQTLTQAEQRSYPKILLKAKLYEKHCLIQLYLLPCIMEVAAKVHGLAVLFGIAWISTAPYVNNASSAVEAGRFSVFGQLAYNFNLITGAEAATSKAQQQSIAQFERRSGALRDSVLAGIMKTRKTFKPDPLLVNAAVEQALGILEEHPNDVTLAVSVGRPCCLKRPFELSFLPYVELALEHLGLPRALDENKGGYESTRVHGPAGLDPSRKSYAWLDIRPADVLVALLPKIRRRHWVYTGTGEYDKTEQFDRFAALKAVLKNTPYLSDEGDSSTFDQGKEVKPKVEDPTGLPESELPERISGTTVMIFLLLVFSILGAISAMLYHNPNAYLKSPMWTDLRSKPVAFPRRRARVSRPEIRSDIDTDGARKEAITNTYMQSMEEDDQKNGAARAETEQSQSTPSAGQTLPNNLQVVLFSSPRAHRRRPTGVAVHQPNVFLNKQVEGKRNREE